MQDLLIHWYASAEGHVIWLVWVTVPLFFFTIYLVFRGTEKHGPN